MSCSYLSVADCSHGDLLVLSAGTADPPTDDLDRRRCDRRSCDPLGLKAIAREPSVIPPIGLAGTICGLTSAARVR
jgi:hypothetical protein